MGCKDEILDKFSSMETELLEDVEPSYLISLSDSQVSNHDILSDFYPSDTLDVSISSVKKGKGGICYSGHECLFKKKPPSADYEKHLTLKPTKEFFDSAFRIQSLKFNDRGDMSFCHDYLKERIIHSIASLNLITYSMDCVYDIGKQYSSFKGCSRKCFSQSRRCVSLPNLNFTHKQEIIYNQLKYLQKIPCISKRSEDSIVNLAARLANTYFFGDFLIKILIEKIHSIKLATEGKDVLISELMHSYDKLIIKHAEAENKIDRMRFDSSVSEGLSTSSTSAFSNIVPNVVNAKFVVHTELANDVLDIDLFEKQEDLGDRKSSSPAVVARRGLRKLEPSKSELDHKKEEFVYGEIGVDVITSEKEIVDTLVKQDQVLLHCDPDIYICELEKLNLENLESNILFEERNDYRTPYIFTDNESFSPSEDELSLRGLGHHDILRTANSLHSEKSFKNNFNNSYNKIISCAKAKRELASYPDFCSLIFNRNESLPNLDTEKVEETFMRPTNCSTTFLSSENKNFKVNDYQSLAVDKVGLAESKSGCIVIDNPSAVHPQPLLEKANTCQTINNNFPEKSSDLLHNVFIQEKNAYVKECKTMPKYFNSRNSDSNIKKAVFNLNETKPIDNGTEMDVKNDFGGNFSDAFPLSRKELIPIKKKGHLEDESLSSVSLGSVELESCDCWNELPSSQSIGGCEQEILPIECKITISPLHLDLSSSDDYSVPIFGTNKQGVSGTLKSLDDATIGAGKKKGLNQRQMKTSFKSPLRDASKRIAESIQSIVSADYSQKSVSQIMNSLNKIDAAATKLKLKTEGLKSYLSLQLDSLS